MKHLDTIEYISDRGFSVRIDLFKRNNLYVVHLTIANRTTVRSFNTEKQANDYICSLQ